MSDHNQQSNATLSNKFSSFNDMNELGPIPPNEKNRSRKDSKNSGKSRKKSQSKKAIFIPKKLISDIQSSNQILEDGSTPMFGKKFEYAGSQNQNLQFNQFSFK